MASAAAPYPDDLSASGTAIGATRPLLKRSGGSAPFDFAFCFGFALFLRCCSHLREFPRFRFVVFSFELFEHFPYDPGLRAGRAGRRLHGAAAQRGHDPRGEQTGGAEALRI